MRYLLTPAVLALSCSMLVGQSNCPLVQDINKITAPYSSNPTGSRVGPGNSTASSFVKCGSFYYFTAFTLATGNELWRTDGTTAGTAFVNETRHDDPSQMHAAPNGGRYLYPRIENPPNEDTQDSLTRGSLPVLRSSS